MRKITTYTILVLILFSFNYKTISYCCHLTPASIVLTQDYDCEEKDSESKKTDDKNEKKDFSEYLFLHRNRPFLLINQLSFSQQLRLLYAGSDYSMAVYCPPDISI